MRPHRSAEQHADGSGKLPPDRILPCPVARVVAHELEQGQIAVVEDMLGTDRVERVILVEVVELAGVRWDLPPRMARLHEAHESLPACAAERGAVRHPRDQDD